MAVICLVGRLEEEGCSGSLIGYFENENRNVEMKKWGQVTGDHFSPKNSIFRYHKRWWSGSLKSEHWTTWQCCYIKFINKLQLFSVWIMLVKVDWSSLLCFKDENRAIIFQEKKKEKKEKAWFMPLRHVNRHMHICTNKYTHIQQPKPKVKLNPRGIKSIGTSGKTVIPFSLLHPSECWLQSASALQPPKAALDYSHSVPRQKT